MRKSFCLVAILFASACSHPASARESGADQLAKLLFIHSVEVEEAEKPYREAIGQLNDNYNQALERAAGKAQKAGQLEQLLSIRNEIKHVQEQGAVGETPYPGHEEMREKYAKAAADIAKQNRSELISTVSRHQGELTKLKVDLTKAGDLEAAMDVSRLIELLTNSLTGDSPVPAPQTASSKGIKFATNAVKDTPLNSDIITATTVELEPGVYELTGKLMLGDDEQEDKEDQFGHVVVPPGSVVRGGELFVNNGSITATGSLFVGTELIVDLHGELKATDCIFDGGKLRKGGAWSTKYYSAKFTLVNCLLNGVFPVPLSPRANGIKVTECTIIGATIAPGEYYETPVEESQNEWRLVERCVFVDCEIPESFLLMTADCVFENCEFIEDIDDVAPEKSATIQMYFRKSAVNPPAGNNRVKFKGEDVIAFRKNFGSVLEYDFSNSANN